MPRKVKEKIIKETRIPVRVVKTTKPPKKAEKAEKEITISPKTGQPFKEQRKGLIIAVSVIVIMLIIFSIWATFLKYNLRQPSGGEQSLWTTIKNNLANGLSGASKTWERITSVFSSSTNQSEEQILENEIFPEIKSNSNQ